MKFMFGMRTREYVLNTVRMDVTNIFFESYDFFSHVLEEVKTFYGVKG